MMSLHNSVLSAQVVTEYNITAVIHTAVSIILTEEKMLPHRNLCALSEGERCVIADIAPSAMSERLKELGFTRGTMVICLCRSFAGDPAAYYVKGTVIALRKEDAAKISVDIYTNP